jgi:hypothetical protein
LTDALASWRFAPAYLRFNWADLFQGDELALAQE